VLGTTQTTLLPVLGAECVSFLMGPSRSDLLRLYQQGEPVSELTTMFGISRSTLFRTLKVLKKQEPLPA
jgi:hypothetical protein